MQINPIETERVPRTASEIRNRVGEIAFGRPLLEELARLDHASRRIRPLAWLSSGGRRLARHRLHRIDGSVVLAGLDPSTKVDPSWPLLERSARLGRDAADDWLRHGAERRRAPSDWLPRAAAGSASAAATPAA